jgi:quercetin dioxygenase-like cupin family protein
MSETTLPNGIRLLDPLTSPSRPASDDRLVGSGTVHPISPALGTDELKVNAVYLDAGARFRPHSHPFDQILYFETGTGIVAVDGSEDVIVPTGHYVLLPAHRVHMHGCTSDGPALQLSLMRDTQTTFDVACPPEWVHWLPSSTKRLVC